MTAYLLQGIASLFGMGLCFVLVLGFMGHETTRQRHNRRMRGPS